MRWEPLLDGAGGDAANQLLAEDEVEHQHWNDCQRQGRQDGVPVGDELTDEHLRAQGDGFGRFARSQNQRSMT